MEKKVRLLDKKYWQFVEDVAREVDNWPDWMNGGRDTKRTVNRSNYKQHIEAKSTKSVARPKQKA